MIDGDGVGDIMGDCGLKVKKNKNLDKRSATLAEISKNHPGVEKYRQHQCSKKQKAREQHSDKP